MKGTSSMYHILERNVLIMVLIHKCISVYFEPQLGIALAFTSNNRKYFCRKLRKHAIIIK